MVTLKRNDGKCTLYIDGNEGTCMINDAKPGDCRIAPLKPRFICTGEQDDFENPERLSVFLCDGTDRGGEITVREAAERSGIIEHLKINIGLTERFAERMGGAEATVNLLENQPRPGEKKWIEIIDYIGELYGVKVRV